jgi:LuxR family maltose regulon positive regulatory protein
MRESGGPGLIERPRLIDKLNLVVDHKLTLISAPPGYGKTTLANQFMRQARLPVVWHSIEAVQRDVPILHQRAQALLEPLAPGIRSLPATYGNPPVELATSLTEYLRDFLTGPIIYIFDDAHYLSGSAPAEAWLRTFVMQLPAKCHVVILSRTLPDLPLTELIARRDVLAIGQEELRFRRDEIYALAAQMRGVPPTAAEIEDWEVRLEGWPAGTILALQPLPEDLERIMLGGVGPEALFNDLARSMLQAQPPSLRQFLLASSTLTRITPELCSEGLRLDDVTPLLVQALNRNLFLARTTGGLAYHALFRDFLQDYLHQTDPDAFRRLHFKAAEWYEQHDQIIEAVDHFLTAEEYQRAIVLVERVADAFFTQGQVVTLLDWEEALRHVKPEIPRLLCACAKIHIERYHYDVALAQIQIAEKAFMRQSHTSGLAEVRILKAMLHLQKGDYYQALEQAEHFLAESPESVHLRGRALTIVGTAYLKLGRITAAIEYLEQALPLYRADGDAYALSSVLQNLEVAYNSQGRLADSAACLQEVVALRRKLGNAGALALALNNLGVHYHQHSDYQRALESFQEGLSVLARVPNQRAESYLLWSMGDLQRDRGAYDEARQLYQRALEIIDTSEPDLSCSLLISLSTLERWQGNHREAVAVATHASVLADKHNLNLLRIQAQASIWAARILLDANQAYIRLTALASQLRSGEADIELAQVLMYCASAAVAGDELETAQQNLSEAVTIAESIALLQPLAAETVHTQTLEVLIKSKQTKYKSLAEAAKQLRRAQYVPTTSTDRSALVTINQDPFKIQVYTLGQENVERDGVRITTTDWRANAARELFFYILFCGPVTREQINLEFWPDSSMQRSRSRFHTTLYRARQALGENVILFQDDTYYLNPETEIWCDALEMENLATQARLLSPRDVRTEDLWRRAFNLYKGEFLLAMDRDWVIDRRELMQDIYIESLIGLGECARARSDFRAALSAFKRALDVDPYREDVNRAIMICYADLGERHQILSHWHHLRELLRQDLAVEPSPETVELANRLLA